MGDEAIWSLEERFWTGGEEHYRGTLDPECVMAFPGPPGILAGTRIIEALRGAPRWSSVSMTERQTGHPSPEIVVVAYRAGTPRRRTSVRGLLHLRLSPGTRQVVADPAPADADVISAAAARRQGTFE
jgi:hypothetical protein